MNPTKKEKNQPISVYVRVRPQSKQELASGYHNVVDIRGKELSVRNNMSEKYHKNFVFDKIFGPDSLQIDVFKTVAEPAVAEIISGYNCTIFAYGQTGTGKTYTMAGGSESIVTEMTSWKEEKHAGIIPRTLSYLFDELRLQQIEYTVRVSYLELYNEEIFDLLSPPEDNTKLKLYDDVQKKGSVIVSGQTEVSVASKGEVYKILESGAEKRRTASTLMNAQSSRSHTIFCVTVHTKESSVDGEDLLKTGKLNLVDLAGSENISKSGTTEKRARETSLINTSLLTLGRCIVALTEHRAHIPYRESKLTRLLRDSLGGRTKTSLIATVSPALSNVEETLNTLDYASRAKHITNKPEMNQRVTKNALLKDYEYQIANLQRDLQATRLCNGIYLASENYEVMLRDLAIQKDEISEKINNIRALKEEMEERDRICTELKFEIEQHLEVVETKTKQIEELETKLDVASSEITTLQVEKEEKEFLVAKHSEAEQMLHVTAVKLLTAAESSTSDIEKLHTKLDVIADLNKQNKLTCEQHINDFNNKIKHVQEKTTDFLSYQDKFHIFFTALVSEMTTKQNEVNDKHSKLINTFPEFLKNLSEEEKNIIKQDNVITSKIDSTKEIYEKLTGTNQNEINKMWEEKFVPTIKRMFKHLEDQTTKYENVIKIFSDLILNNSVLIKNDITELQNDIIEVKQKVYEQLDTTNELITKVCKCIVSSILDKQTVQKKAEENFNKIAQYQNIILQTQFETQNLLSNGYKVNKMHCDKALNGLIDMSSKLKICENDTGRLVKIAIDKTDDVKINLDLTTHTANKIVQAENQELQDAFKTGKSINKSIYNESKDIMKETQNKLDTQLTTVMSLMDKHQTMISTFSNDNVKFLQEFKEKLSQQGEEHKNINDETNEYYKSSLNTISMQVFDNKTECAEHKTHAMLELDKCRENVKKLFTTHIKEYRPTGCTPNRKKYKYPRAVPPAMSSELLLEDFRKSKFDIPEDDDDTENIYEGEQIIMEKLDNKSSEKLESDTVNNSQNGTFTEDTVEKKKRKILSNYNGGNIPVLKKN